MVQLGFLVFFLFGNVNCAFFDLTDVEDPLSLLWHTNKDTSDGQRNRRCFGILNDGSVATGQCKHKSECLLAGGKLHFNYGSCGFLSTCCIQQICSYKSNAKVSHFNSDDFNRNLSECTYVVEAQNDNICQMRIDFESFELSHSQERAVGTNPSGIPITQSYERVCSIDYLQISPNTYNIPILCGSNNKQHVYVHLYSNRHVTLRFHLENRRTTVNTQVVSNPHWKIKITQLECPGFKNFFTKHTTFKLNEDFKLLAPAGAIQYFLAPTGRIRSFGYDGTTGDYISGLSYSIAFRRTPSENCIRFSENFIRLRKNLTQVGTPNFCLDYLFVPGLQTSLDEKYGSQLCSMLGSTQTTSQNFYLTLPGPFYIHFISHLNYTVPPALRTLVHAFDLQYDLTSCT